MKIAMIAPISWRTPPRNYGPWEQVVSNLTEGLVAKGIDVTLFATADSKTKAKLVSVCPRPIAEDPELDGEVYKFLHISQIFERAREFDIIHNQFDYYPLPFSYYVKTPVVTTIHGFHSPQFLKVYEKYNDRVFYVSISNADRTSTINYLDTIYHGIDLKDFIFNPNPEDYLLFLGRISYDKGTHFACELARITGEKLIIAGIIPPEEEEYYEKKVKPLIDGKQIKFIGPVTPAPRNKILGRAKALLHLITFNEPFGLSMVESMACGTPVIAINRGSVPEVIIDGKTGFIIENTNEAVGAVKRIEEINRADCRRHVEENFTVDKMVERYLKAYKKILRNPKK